MIRALSTVGLPEVEKAIVKATYDDQEAPKAKHVKTLIELTQPPAKAAPVVVALIRRLKACQYWNEVTKTLIVIHMLCSDVRAGAVAVLNALATTLPLNQCVTNFEDKHDFQTKGHSKYALEYANFLTAKVHVYTALGRSIEQLAPLEDEKWPASLSKERLLHAIPLVVHQIEDGLKLRPFTWNALCHIITARSSDLLYKDVVRIWNAGQNMFKELRKYTGELEKRELLQAAKWADRMNQREFDALMLRLMSIGSQKPVPRCPKHAEDAAVEWRTLAMQLASPTQETALEPVETKASSTKASTRKLARLPSQHAAMPPPHKSATPRRRSKTAAAASNSSTFDAFSMTESRSRSSTVHPNTARPVKTAIVNKDTEQDPIEQQPGASGDTFSLLTVNVESPDKAPQPLKTLGHKPNRDWSVVSFFDDLPSPSTQVTRNRDVEGEGDPFSKQLAASDTEAVAQSESETEPGRS
eukprot:gb/GEZN01005484.1/.p1 GENE.gb/GEZN01005484.1/~~gb/GEZN01005484.1/.p1  ORF type:complete len:470 (-),score=76.85 gb/GEZN01005484.1/:273-1682(-)